MKRIVFVITLSLASLFVFAQESSVTIGGGYSFVKVEDINSNATGFRVNALFEFNPQEGSWAHGFSFGYIGLKASGETILNQEIDYKMNTWPAYYALKFMIGENNFKGFVKGAAGIHFSGYKRTTANVELSSNDSGFYGGASVGGSYKVNDNVFINLEYEWAYLANDDYKDGVMNSAMFGIGFKF